MNFEQKYLKYKNKYLVLRKQNGGAFNPENCANLEKIKKDIETCRSSYDKSIPGREIIFHKAPNYFLALESDNIGLFDKNNSTYYDVFPLPDTKPARPLKRELRLNVRDEKNNLHVKDCHMVLEIPNSLMVVKENDELYREEMKNKPWSF